MPATKRNQNKKSVRTSTWKSKITEHHRKPRSKGGRKTKRNISRVPRKQHEAFHTLFGDKYPEEIANILNQTWIDPDYLVIIIPKDWLIDGKKQTPR